MILHYNLDILYFWKESSTNIILCFWHLRKPKKKVHLSLLENDVRVFSGSFEVTCIIKHHLNLIKRLWISLSAITDSASLFDILTNASRTTDKLLVIGLKLSKIHTNNGNTRCCFHAVWILHCGCADRIEKANCVLLTLFKLQHLINQYNNDLFNQTKVMQLLKKVVFQYNS